MKLNVDVFLISISKPILLGIYQNHQLIEEKIIEGKASDVFPSIFENLLDKYNIKNIFFINGPGSFMAIKITYVFLKTISIVKDIKLHASDGFNFVKSGFIKAHRNQYFIKNNGEISTIISEEVKESDFFLPKALDYKLFSDKIKPNYILPAA